MPLIKRVHAVNHCRISYKLLRRKRLAICYFVERVCRKCQYTKAKVHLLILQVFLHLLFESVALRFMAYMVFLILLLLRPLSTSTLELMVSLALRGVENRSLMLSLIIFLVLSRFNWRSSSGATKRCTVRWSRTRCSRSCLPSLSVFGQGKPYNLE